jgi:hypothetical protein
MPVKPPRPPRWTNERAVLDLITRWFDEHEYSEVMAHAAADDGGPVRITRSLDLHDLVVILKSGEQISPRNRAHFAKLIEDLIEQPKRRLGRPPKPIEERRSVSIMPEAKALCLAVIDFLRFNYPGETSGVIKDRAILWTVEKIRTYEPVGIEHLTAAERKRIKPLTKTKLRNYLNRGRRNRRVL